MRFALLIAILFTAAGRIPAVYAGEMDDLTLEDFLPSDVYRDAVAALKRIPFDEGTLKGAPSLLHLSGEVSSHGAEVYNRIHFFEGKRFDVWHSRHTSHGQKLPNGRHGPDFGRLEFFAILVDKKPTPKKAYYLEFRPEPVRAGKLPRPKAYVVGCYGCHSSGPRVIRPQPLAMEATPASLRTMREWNRKIMEYGVVETHIPGGAAENLPAAQLVLMEPVKHGACVGCHDGPGTLRAPLRRLHKQSILALVDSAESPDGFFVKPEGHEFRVMPKEGPPLSAGDRRCLEAWLANETGARPVEGCNERGEAVARTEPKLLAVNPAGSWVKAVAKSMLLDVTVKGLLVSGALECDAASSCAGELRADLRRARTGVALRDRHLREKLSVARDPFASVSLAAFSFPGSGGPTRVATSATVVLAGKRADYPVALECETRQASRRCRIRELAVTLSRHGVTPPSFLGVGVEDTVTVSGEISFDEMSTEREMASDVAKR